MEPTVTKGGEGSGSRAVSPRISEANAMSSDSGDEPKENLEIEEEELKLRQALHDKAMADQHLERCQMMKTLRLAKGKGTEEAQPGAKGTSSAEATQGKGKGVASQLSVFPQVNAAPSSSQLPIIQQKDPDQQAVIEVNAKQTQHAGDTENIEVSSTQPPHLGEDKPELSSQEAGHRGGSEDFEKLSATALSTEEISEKTPEAATDIYPKKSCYRSQSGRQRIHLFG
ncbi:hypothetical protein U1Q18_003356 [Sarracenia purpurea var. burkii]